MDIIWEDRLPLCNWFSLKAARHSFQSTFLKMTMVCPGRKGKKKFKMAEDIKFKFQTCIH